jgi:hypothetical protein
MGFFVIDSFSALEFECSMVPDPTILGIDMVCKGEALGKDEEGIWIVEIVGYEECSRCCRSHTSHFISLGNHFSIPLPCTIENLTAVIIPDAFFASVRLLVGPHI